MVNIQEQFRAPSWEELAHSQQVDGVLKVCLRFPESEPAVVIFQFFESNEKFRCDVI